jgi:hypothetical protein
MLNPYKSISFMCFLPKVSVAGVNEEGLRKKD